MSSDPTNPAPGASGAGVPDLRGPLFAAQEWIAEHVGGEVLWWGAALVVEPRYARDLACGMFAAGLRVGDEGDA